MKHSAVSVMALCLWASPALAREDAMAHLRWEGVPSEGCVTELELRTLVEQRMGRPVFVSEDRADIILETSSSAPTSDNRRSVSVTLRSRAGVFWGTRQIETDASCDAIRDSLVLMLSLTADIAKEEVERRVQLDRRSRFSLAIQGMASSVYGLLPSVALGPELAVGVNSPLLGWWELGAAHYPAQVAGSRPRAELEAGLLTLRSCPLALHGVDISVWACAAFRAGYLKGQGHEFDTSLEQTEAMLSLGAGLRAIWEVAYPVFLVSNIGADGALRGAEFFYEQGGVRHGIFTTEPALFVIDIGFGVTLD